jgi:hypothetical protein
MGVTEGFLDVMAAPAIFAAVEKAHKVRRANRKPPARPKVEAINFAEELAKLERRRKKVRDMYELDDEGRMPEEEFRAKLAELNRRIADLQAKQAAVPVVARALPPPPEDLAARWALLADRPMERHQLLSTLLERIVVEKGQLRVMFRPYDHPGWPSEITIPIVRLCSREGRAARGDHRNGRQPQRS